MLSNSFLHPGVGASSCARLVPPRSCDRARLHESTIHLATQMRNKSPPPIHPITPDPKQCLS